MKKGIPYEGKMQKFLIFVCAFVVQQFALHADFNNCKWNAKLYKHVIVSGEQSAQSSLLQLIKPTHKSVFSFGLTLQMLLLSAVFVAQNLC